MVDFGLTARQRRLRELAQGFASEEIRPVAWELDRTAAWPDELIGKAWMAGLMNTHVPKRLGGSGLSILEGVLVEEALAWGCSGVQNTLGCNTIATWPVLLAGSERLQRRYVCELLDEPRLASFALTEPGAGSDVAGLRTRAQRRGAGWVITGSKCFITNGGHASWFVVFAKTDLDAGHRGISAFLVPREAGVVADKKEDKLGQRASETAAITLDEVAVPRDHLLGELNGGWQLAMAVLNRTRPNVAAMAVGIARSAFEFALNHARERGRLDGEHQATQFALADMATEIDAARLLTWRAAALQDRGERNVLAASQAKRFAADTCMRVTLEAVEIYGAQGGAADRPVEKLMRDAKVMQIYEGTSQIQRLVIARELAKS